MSYDYPALFAEINTAMEAVAALRDKVEQAPTDTRAHEAFDSIDSALDHLDSARTTFESEDDDDYPADPPSQEEA